MVTLLIFIAVLAVLVLSHEFGHFIVARKNGIKVSEFGFGFPPRIVGIRWVKRRDLSSVLSLKGEKGATAPPFKEGAGGGQWHIVWGNKNIQNEVESVEHQPGTVYSINWLPLGGFVRIKGEDSTGPEANDADSFAIKKPWQKSLVLVAGVAMNIIVAAVMLSVGLMIGVPQVADGSAPGAERHIEVLQVLSGKPAEAAGILAGDVILSVGNQANPTVADLQDYVNLHKDETLAVKIQRGSTELTKNIHQTVYADTGKGGLGVAIAEINLVRYPWYSAIYHGVILTGVYLKEIVLAFYGLVAGLFKGHGMGADVSGPVGVAVMTGQVARLGWVYLLQFMAMLSLNLAVLNILPIPALDGGRLLFVIINKIKGKPVSARTEQIFHSVGFVLLLILVLAVTIKDIAGFWSAISGWVKAL